MKALLGLVMVLAACEQTAIVEGKVTVAPDRASASDLLVIVDGQADATLAWSPLGLAGEYENTLAQGQLSLSYRWEQFGKPAHALYVAAFLDLNRNGVLDVGEPFGEFADNPLVDAPWGTTAPASTADVAIDQP